MTMTDLEARCALATEAADRAADAAAKAAHDTHNLQRARSLAVLAVDLLSESE